MAGIPIQKRDNFPCWLAGIHVDHQRFGVTLGGAALSFAAMIAEKRVHRNHQAQVRDHNQSGRDPFQVHFEGFCAEIAFGALIGVAPDLGTEPRQGGEDFLLSGLMVDVKACPGNNMNIDWRKREGSRACDLYVAMAGPYLNPKLPNGETYDYAGHANHDFVFQHRWTNHNTRTGEPYQAIPLAHLEIDREYLYSISGR